ncbi:MAG: carbamoyltransferase C-terminal domain-containing protein, partial [Candidatus Rickettsiella isopodorum]|nr:carbamoyltransferase C-terminal domain-containing protein [Candidatus Rickettsiella isopodorum]
AGVVHIDGSARIQTVSRDINPQYYSLIEEFKAITDISVLLNTSFNGREMPIVETPQDAIDFFVKSKAMDVLVIEDYILIKKVNVNKAELCEVGLHVVTIE